MKYWTGKRIPFIPIFEKLNYDYKRNFCLTGRALLSPGKVFRNSQYYSIRPSIQFNFLDKTLKLSKSLNNDE